MSLGYCLAWLLPWVTGAGICLALNRGRRLPGDLAAAAGTGFLLGLFLAAVLGKLLALENTGATFARVAPWLAGIGILAWAAVFAFRHPSRSPSLLASADGFVGRLLWFLLLAAILIRLDAIVAEALLRPTFPWDAWSAWAVKPKAWFLLGHHVVYVPIQEWLARPAADLRTSAIWDYPELLAWIQIWFASAAGGWNEPLINAVWTGVLGAIGLASYGHWRALGIRPGLSMLLVYGLLSLPLLDAHAALAGYADLWLAAAFGMAVLCWLRWVRQRNPGQLVLALLFAVCLPLIKLEGAVWLMLFAAVALLGLLSRRLRWIVLAALVVCIGVGIALGGFHVPIFGLGWVHVSWGQVTIPALGELDLYWRPVGSEMLSGLLTLPNWHLLWYLVPLVVLLRWRVFVADRSARSLSTLVAACVAFLFVLFFFTDASAWAENYTSANRLVLHVVPAVFTLMALLLADTNVVSADKRQVPRAPTVPA
ncbi:MAG TPA: hypothetical protein VFN25_13575 [Dokdonella sp.]|uniref:hypothetical protein n=1 Tax=Dokdonella sp. TaxID=2291710 RepID=UPI002D7E4750|nr:hypothetical protein [Dokdonella sp.]HET9033919.1 hypothetical protein [Dokdonella sp.]